MARLWEQDLSRPDGFLASVGGFSLVLSSARRHPARMQVPLLALGKVLLCGLLALGGLDLARAADTPRDPSPAAAARPLLRFVQWNDLHVDSSNTDYRLVNEKADYLVSSLNSGTHFPAPDFVVGVGDLITGEGSGLPKLTADFNLLKTKLARLKCPLYPVMGNHENIQAEGDAALEAPYREAFGAVRVNYTFEAAGILFVMLDNSGAPASNGTAAGHARREWLRGVFQKSPDAPKILCAHIPLWPVRDPEILAKSFVHGSETAKDDALASLVAAPSNKVVAVLSGHLHLTGVARVGGLWQIVVSGTASYPCDYACYEVFRDHIRVRMFRLPENLVTPDTDNFGPPLRPVAYADPAHPTHEAYLSGNPSERDFEISLKAFPPLSGGRVAPSAAGAD